MITLNDYLYSGDTIYKILLKYSADLKASAIRSGNQIDLAHCNFLLQIMELLEHNEFLSSQSDRIHEFYSYMVKKYPHLAFTFKGRIKSLIRSEEKFNGYIVEYIYNYFKEHGSYPNVPLLKSQLSCFRDLLAYRIVLSLPKCHLLEGQDQRTEELNYLYEIADLLPDFFEERGFSADLSGLDESKFSPRIRPALQPYYRDYIVNRRPLGYESLHITLYDNIARCFVEIQMRTKEMDDNAEIGPANHLGYEKKQENNRMRRDEIPYGDCIYFDDAYERLMKLQQLDLSQLDVNMFGAVNNSLINDGCGLYRGRQIRPFEHLSRFQTEEA